MNKKQQKAHVRQQGQSDCGVACLKAVLQYFGGGDTSLERLRELSGTTPQGTTMLGLVQAGQQLGIDTEGYEADMESLKTCEDITILHVLMDKTLQHYVVCYGYNNGKGAFIIGDPAKNTVEYLTVNALEDIWQSKSLLIVKPTDALKKVVDSRRAKGRWLINFIREDLDILAISAVLGVVLAILSLTTALFSQKLIDQILPAKDQFKLISGCILLFVLLLARGFLGYLRQLLMLKQRQSFNVRLIDYFYSALLNLPKSFFDSRKTGELVARMNDTQRIQNTISALVGNSVIDVLLVIVSTVSIFMYDVKLGGLALLWLPIVAWIALRFHPKIVGAQTAVMQGYARSESHYIETMQGVGEIKINNRQPFFTELTRTIYGFFQQNSVELGKIGGRYGLWMEIVATIFIAVVTLMSSLLVLNDALSIGSIIAILQIIGMLMSSVNRLAITNISIQEATIAFERMNEFTELNSEFSAEDDFSKSVISDFQELEVDNLTFRFAGRKRLLDGVSFHINKGEMIALIGESGSGKSTMLQVLQKFYEGESGKIKVNGIDFDLLSTAAWRSIIGVVPQDVRLFSGTLIDNILLGDPSVSADKLTIFFEKYGFNRFFEQFPNGYATILGENGVNISGGQTQLVGLARALWKCPQILLLDEPTAALDRDSEQFVIQLLNKIKSETATLILTHRLSIVRGAERIYILKNGQIEEEGNHLQLLKSDNLYSRSWLDWKAA
jgi:ATP-binding cassette, subfamily C, bacteriocin exporter